MKTKLLMTFLVIGTLTFSCEDQGMLITERNAPFEVDNATLRFDEKLYCDLPDPSITAINIDYGSFPPYVIMPGTAVKFSYTFNTTNLGNGQLSFKENDLFFQTWLSKDATLGNADDVAAGGSTYLHSGEPDVILPYGETHIDSWANYSGADLFQYRYLIVEVKTFNTRFNECTASNNYLVKYIDVPRLDDKFDPGPYCDLPDPSITSIDIDYSSFPPIIIRPGDAVKFDYTFNTTNLGGGPLSMKSIYFQTYLSKDASFGNADDVPAGGAVYREPGETDFVLLTGQTYKDSWHSWSDADLYTYKYLIVVIKSGDKYFSECSTANNYLVQYIDVPRLAGNKL